MPVSNTWLRHVRHAENERERDESEGGRAPALEGGGTGREEKGKTGAEGGRKEGDLVLAQALQGGGVGLGPLVLHLMMTQRCDECGCQSKDEAINVA